MGWNASVSMLIIYINHESKSLATTFLCRNPLYIEMYQKIYPR